MLSLLRGPLNQRASQVQSNVHYNTSGMLQLRMAQHLPDGYSGVDRYSRTPVYETARLTPVFTKILQEYSYNRDVAVDYSKCGKSCVATVNV